MVDFIRKNRICYGVESICEVLPIAPSTFYQWEARHKDPALLPARAKRDARLGVEIDRVWHANRQVYGVRKVWKQLNREGFKVARCSVQRLMREKGLQGVVRGRRFKTTQPDEAAAWPADLVDRNFTATRPNQLWVADLTYVATWRGRVYVALVIDAFSRSIVGWRASASLKTDIALDALEQALWSRSDTEGPDSSQRPGSAVPVDSLYGAVGRGRHRAFGWKQRRLLRQRAGGIGHRAV